MAAKSPVAKARGRPKEERLGPAATISHTAKQLAVEFNRVLRANNVLKFNKVWAT